MDLLLYVGLGALVVLGVIGFFIAISLRRVVPTKRNKEG